MKTECFRDISKLMTRLDEIPAGARVVLEGGHLSLDVVSSSKNDISLLHGPVDDILFLIEVESGTPPITGEEERIRVGDRAEGNLEWSLVPAAAMGAWLEEVDLEPLDRMYRVSFRPTRTQKESLRLALECFKHLEEKAELLQLAILVGNFELPYPEMRSLLLEHCIPSSYRDLLAEFRATEHIELYSEATCRNRGRKYLLKARRDLTLSDDLADSVYKESAFSIFKEDHGDAYYLASDLILEIGLLPAFVALTKQSGTPTCGLILAGKLFSMASREFEYFLSVYDLADDNTIQQKNKDGALIFGHLATGLEMEVILCTTNTVGQTRRILHIDHFSPEDFTGPGLHLDRSDLVADALRRSPEYTRRGEGEPPTCCTVPPRKP